MQSFSPSAATAFMVRTILALVQRCLMGAFVSHFQTQPLSTDLSSRKAWRIQRLSSVDMILPASETRLCRRGNRLAFLGDSFVFNGAAGGAHPEGFAFRHCLGSVQCT